jgi:hypothetical protein
MKSLKKSPPSLASIGLVLFEWPVATDGYEVPSAPRGRSIGSGGAASLLSAPLKTIQPRSDETHPLIVESEPALHRKFAEVKSEKELIAFVDQYGLLFENSYENTVAVLLRCAERVRTTLDAIEGIKPFDKAMARTHAELTEEGVPLPPRQAFAVHVFNERILDASPRFYIRVNPVSRQVQFQPRSLWGWIWMKLAEELTDGVKWRRCKDPQCQGEPFFPIGKWHPDGRRINAEYCGKANCRQAVYDRKVASTKAKK